MMGWNDGTNQIRNRNEEIGYESANRIKMNLKRIDAPVKPSASAD
jgi:hypothetical protein